MLTAIVLTVVQLDTCRAREERSSQRVLEHHGCQVTYHVYSHVMYSTCNKHASYVRSNQYLYRLIDRGEPAARTVL